VADTTPMGIAAVLIIVAEPEGRCRVAGGFAEKPLLRFLIYRREGSHQLSSFNIRRGVAQELELPGIEHRESVNVRLGRSHIEMGHCAEKEITR